jgi:hypothetical protein
MVVTVPVPSVLPVEVNVPEDVMLKTCKPLVTLNPAAIKYLPVLSTPKAETFVGPTTSAPTEVITPLPGRLYPEIVLLPSFAV